jgi:phosphoribosylamine--glycine ligase
VAKVLVIGSGGREHALVWKLAQSKLVDKIYVAPGNGGTENIAENVDIGFTDVAGLLKFAQEKNIDLAVVGQEAASELGVVDAFRKARLKIFGPTKAAAEIESSKAFSKDLMHEEKIPTAEYKTFSDAGQAISYIKTKPFPVVIKADGLATGKGVIIAQNFGEAKRAIDDIMVKKIFGESGSKVVIEDFMKGYEVSAHALCDGKKAVLFPTSQDHKQAFDNDQGPNTGGMGVFGPVPWVTDNHMKVIKEQIVQRALDGLGKQGRPFTGCLYPGLMIDGEDVKVVEFNSRFGDPEAEVYMRLLDADLYDVLLSCSQGQLNPESVKWRPGFAVCVALASKGYPGNYQKGDLISGTTEAEKLEDIVVFHAGTKKDIDGLRTAGGRVLYVSAIGDTLDEAINKAYDAVNLIHFDGMHYRKDIGRRPQPS